MKYLISIIILFAINCERYNSEQNIPKQYDKNYNVVIIDSCEYIEYDCGILENRVYTLTHKGNCKYCAERRH